MRSLGIGDPVDSLRSTRLLERFAASFVSGELIVQEKGGWGRGGIGQGEYKQRPVNILGGYGEMGGMFGIERLRATGGLHFRLGNSGK